MAEPVWLTVRDVVVMHRLHLAEHGGRSGFSREVLERALAVPRERALKGRPRPAMLAESLARAILQHRPFASGNVRSAFMAMMVFLRMNGMRLVAPLAEKFAVFGAFAAGRIAEGVLADWIELRYLAGREGVTGVARVRAGGRTVTRVTVRKSAPAALAGNKELQDGGRRADAGQRTAESSTNGGKQ